MVRNIEDDIVEEAMVGMVVETKLEGLPEGRRQRQLVMRRTESKPTP